MRTLGRTFFGERSRLQAQPIPPRCRNAYSAGQFEASLMQPDEAYAVELPTLKMEAVDDRFEGYWVDARGEREGGIRAPKLKLVRYRS